MKTCKKCEESKDYSSFYKDKSIKDGFDIYCKECNKIRKAQYYLDNKEWIDERNSKWKEANRDKLREDGKVYYQLNKEKTAENKKEYRLKNKDIIRIKNKEYWETKGRERKRLRDKERMKNDPLFKLRRTIKCLIYNSIKNGGFGKKSKSNEILGISYNEFKLYIENKFSEGMTWENHGDWHFDHITPISWAKTEDEIYKLNHYSNFQPLWREDNLSKGNKYEG
jgi:hypothetical protein